MIDNQVTTVSPTFKRCLGAAMLNSHYAGFFNYASAAYLPENIKTSFISSLNEYLAESEPVDPTELTVEEMRLLGFIGFKGQPDNQLSIPVWLTPFLVDEFEGFYREQPTTVKRDSLLNGRFPKISYGVLADYTVVGKTVDNGD